MDQPTFEELQDKVNALERENATLREAESRSLSRLTTRFDLALECAQMAFFEWDIAADHIESWYAGRSVAAEGSLHAAGPADQ